MTGANTTTSGLPAADSLTGEEIVGIIQSGSNVRTTVLGLSAYVSSYIGGSSGYHDTPTIPIGQSASAATGGIAIGHSADVRNVWGIAIGGEAYAAYAYTIALGVYTSTIGEFDIVIGYSAKGSYNASIAIGKESHSYGNNSIAIGTQAHALNQTSIAIGDQAHATANYAIAIGGEAYASVQNSIAIGVVAGASASYSIVIGYDSRSQGTSSVAIGRHVQLPAETEGAIGIGCSVQVNESYSIAFGYRAEAYGVAAMAFGKYAKTFGENSIAIGNLTYAQAAFGIAIGHQANTLTVDGVGGLSIAIGYQATTKNTGSIAIGEEAYASHGSITIGNAYDAHPVKATGYNSIAMMNSYAVGNNSIAIGNVASIAPGALSITTSTSLNYGLGSILIGGANSTTGSSSSFSISIGNEIYSGASYSVHIGNAASGISKYGIAIGTHASNQNGYGDIAIGWGATVGEAYGIAIGAFASTVDQAALSIGYRSHTISNGSMAVGSYAYAQLKSVALGYDSSAHGQNAIAILGNTVDGVYGSIVIGYASHANYSGSIVLGVRGADFSGGSFVTRGVNTISFSVSNTPTKHEMKFTGTTTAGAQGGASFEGSDWNDIILAPVGAASNTYTLLVVDVSGTPNHSFSVAFADNFLTINLATDGSGVVTTTLGDINGDLPGGWSSVIAEGVSGTIASDGNPGNYSFGFSGGSDAVNAVLTSDGDTPGALNMPVFPANTITRVTGSVVGYDFHILSGSSTDAGTFMLATGFLMCDHLGNNSFIGTPPVFTFEIGTEGAATWDVPTLTIVDNKLTLAVTAPTTTASASWLGFINLEANT